MFYLVVQAGNLLPEISRLLHFGRQSEISRGFPRGILRRHPLQCFVELFLPHKVFELLLVHRAVLQTGRGAFQDLHTLLEGIDSESEILLVQQFSVHLLLQFIEPFRNLTELFTDIELLQRVLHGILCGVIGLRGHCHLQTMSHILEHLLGVLYVLGGLLVHFCCELLVSCFEPAAYLRINLPERHLALALSLFHDCAQLIRFARDRFVHFLEHPLLDVHDEKILEGGRLLADGISQQLVQSMGDGVRLLDGDLLDGRPHAGLVAPQLIAFQT